MSGNGTCVHNYVISYRKYVTVRCLGGHLATNEVVFRKDFYSGSFAYCDTFQVDKYALFRMFVVLACDSNPCQNSATCFDLPNAYACACVPGYEGKLCVENATSHLSV